MTSQLPHLKHPKYRRDIDGLRAIAVLAVVAYHAFPAAMAGGFIGVDVFFVISGYLISTILFENFKNESFSFIEFYLRRIRRIFPALCIVLATCFIFGWFALLANEFKQLGTHIAAGATFISNLVLWSESGYFDTLAETKPLLHLWSLGIEEQFYIVWPLVLWIASKRNLNLFLTTFHLMIASFVFSVTIVKHDPTAAFYSPLARFWELMVGSVLAWISLNRENGMNIQSAWRMQSLGKVFGWSTLNCRQSNLNSTISVIGISILLFGFFYIDKDMGFPGTWALLPVMGTALIIVAGPRAWINRTALSSQVAVWFGLISFPLYLWHWPMLSFARVIESETPSATLRVSAVAAAIGLAALTFYFIERPIRASKQSRAQTATLVASMIILGGLGLMTKLQNGFQFRTSSFEINQQQLIPPPLKESIARCKELLPNFTGDCLSTSGNSPLSSFGLVFLGDSHSWALAMALMEQPQKTNVLQLGKNGCPPLKNVDRFNHEIAYHCDAYYDQALNVFGNQDFQNSTLVLNMYYTAYYSGEGFSEVGRSSISNGGVHIQPKGSKVQGSKDLYISTFTHGLEHTLQDVSPKFKRVVIVLQPPELSTTAERCITRPLRKGQTDCRIDRYEVESRQQGYRNVIESAVRRYQNVTIFDPTNLFCDHEFCRPIMEGKMLYRDDNHIGLQGSELVTKTLLLELEKASP